MACYKLEEYETALEAFEQGAELTDTQKNPQFSIWAQKCRIALAGAQGMPLRSSRHSSSSSSFSRCQLVMADPHAVTARLTAIRWLWVNAAAQLQP